MRTRTIQFLSQTSTYLFPELYGLSTLTSLFEWRWLRCHYMSVELHIQEQVVIHEGKKIIAPVLVQRSECHWMWITSEIFLRSLIKEGIDVSRTVLEEWQDHDLSPYMSFCDETSAKYKPNKVKEKSAKVDYYI